jgi:signal transduction histidine kinase
VQGHARIPFEIEWSCDVEHATILVVEDEHVVAHDIRRTLELFGYNVPTIVSTGRQAVETADKLRPELVLMDIMLGGDMDGVAAATEIRARLTIPVVFLTSHSDDATLTRAARTQPFGYVVKPFSDRDLDIAISFALKKSALCAEDAGAAAGPDPDVGPRTQLERRLAQSERLASLGSMTAVMIHEINNALAYVMSNLAFSVKEVERIDLDLRRELGAAGLANGLVFERALSDMGVCRDALHDASEGTDRILNIVESLRGFGRVQAFESRAIHLPRVIDTAARMTTDTTKGLSAIRAEYGPAPEVDGSEGPLTQVFTNLLLNASHAIVEGHGTDREILIQTFTDPKGWAIVEIHDNGVGIPSDVLPHIFDPFFSTKGPAGGTGLGLFICRSILRTFGGEITAESSAGRGTTFRIALPAARASTQKKERMGSSEKGLLS